MEYPTHIVLKAGVNKILTLTWKKCVIVCPLCWGHVFYFPHGCIEALCLPHYYSHPPCGEAVVSYMPFIGVKNKAHKMEAGAWNSVLLLLNQNLQPFKKLVLTDYEEMSLFWTLFFHFHRGFEIDVIGSEIMKISPPFCKCVSLYPQHTGMEVFYDSSSMCGCGWGTCAVHWPNNKHLFDRGVNSIAAV